MGSLKTIISPILISLKFTFSSTATTSPIESSGDILFIANRDNKVAGYVTLAMSNLSKAAHKSLKNITNYPDIPALLLGQMARNLDYARVGMGRYMIDWVINLGTKLSKNVGCRIIILNSVPDKIKWYEDDNFVYVDNSNNTMFFDLLE